MLQIFAGIAEWRTSKLAKQSHNTCQHAEHVSCKAETTPDSCGEYIKMYTNQKNSNACTAKNNTENSKQLFQEKELRSQGPNFYTLMCL
jgi:hypothetical protein